jgi:hypothetical protein
MEDVKGGHMKNIILDLMMGLICIILIFTIIGMMIIPDVIGQWADMRK